MCPLVMYDGDILVEGDDKTRNLDRSIVSCVGRYSPAEFGDIL